MDVPTEATLAAHEIANHLHAIGILLLKLDAQSRQAMDRCFDYSQLATELGDQLVTQNPLPPLSEDDKNDLFQWLCEQEEENCDTVRNRVKGRIAGWTDADWFQEAINKADYEKAVAEEDADLPNMPDYE